ncbi:hypothetical protein PHSY_004462 [Pseudozyma hubeiensis SY62]|uniref:Uncharacterized protein n=1 Tax=Pseudozyma hubeiensis (strain SY62) TaxID=1305764 RepID=R9P654_PSEHS|nr:hypothetical protein PHSY_004462 [Pseudozyma hubeiensis SY62]GAC96878.1 hypothetical protein PHSY_004462 [Pseudozyma hubeiensis SY62]
MPNLVHMQTHKFPLLVSQCIVCAASRQAGQRTSRTAQQSRGSAAAVATTILLLESSAIADHHSAAALAVETALNSVVDQ